MGIGDGISGNGTAVSSYGFEENISIANNEICDIPYSAIGIGYGWSYDYKGSRNHYIANNYIHETNQILMDGAAIYTLSCQDGMVIENNYIENTGVGRGLYSDQGSGGILFRNNVVLDTSYAFFCNMVKNPEVVNLYSTTNKTRKSGISYIDGIYDEIYGSISQTAQKIKDDAGVDKRYNQLEGYISDGYGTILTEEQIMSLEHVKDSSGIKEAILDSIDIILNHGMGIYDDSVINKLNEYKTSIQSDYSPEKLAEIRDYLRMLESSI